MNGEGNQALVANVRKEKGRNFTKNIDRISVSENKKDMQKIICYKYNKLGYYAKYCTQQIKKRKLMDWICIQKEEEQLKIRVNLVHYNKL